MPAITIAGQPRLGTDIPRWHLSDDRPAARASGFHKAPYLHSTLTPRRKRIASLDGAVKQYHGTICQHLTEPCCCAVFFQFMAPPINHAISMSLQQASAMLARKKEWLHSFSSCHGPRFSTGFVASAIKFVVWPLRQIQPVVCCSPASHFAPSRELGFLGWPRFLTLAPNQSLP